MPGEQVIYRAKLHWIVFLLPIILGVVGVVLQFPGLTNSDMQAVGCGGVILLLLAALSGVSAAISYTTSEFAVTSKRVLVKVGFIRRHSLELLLTKVEGVGVDQGILGRILGYGTIVVTGTGGTNEPFKNIADPLEFRKQVQSQVSAP
jgi:uncharacterized membrane protein YdbT with pleckstrin-like domain